MKIVGISDLHGNLPELPECDLLIIAGDICPGGINDEVKQIGWMQKDLIPWIRGIAAKNIVATPGNHDVSFQNFPNIINQLFSSIDNFCLLNNSSVEIDGLKIWGTPNSLPYGKSYAFMYDEGVLDGIFEQIPLDTNIIISHGPPYGYGDLTIRTGEHVGSKSLEKHLYRICPEIVCFGHIHEGYGEYILKGYTHGNSKMYNCSLVDHHKADMRTVVNKPHIINI